MQYRIEWTYLGELADGQWPRDEAHCSFLIRFLERPPGPGHCAFLGMNVVTPAKARELGLAPEGRRGFLVVEHLSQAAFQDLVSKDVAEALAGRSQLDALSMLDRKYIVEGHDYREEIVADAPTADAMRALIEAVFAGVTRGSGVTLREALAEDDYAGPEAKKAARELDTDTDWHDVPKDVMRDRCEFFSYLDGPGFRYYIPAAMCFSLDAENRASSETPQRTYWSLLPTVAPRDFGKGHGGRFDVEAFITGCGFDGPQVQALYAFLCFMAVVADEGVDEEQLPAIRKWRESARRRRPVGVDGGI